MNTIVNLAAKKAEKLSQDEREILAFEAFEKSSKARKIIGLSIAGCLIAVYLTGLIYWVNMGIPMFVVKFLEK